MSKTPVMFVHGLWLHSSSWDAWASAFDAAGYASHTPEWPGVPDTVADARATPDSQAGNGLTEITDHLASYIRGLDAPPILIGHSVGGFLVQKLLGMNLGAAAIAYSPGQIKGVKAVGLGQARTAGGFLSNPTNLRKSVSLTPRQFKAGFANAVSQAESDEMYEKWTIPSPARPLFQLGFGNFQPDAPSQVETGNNSRGPLLLVAAKKDTTVDSVLVRSAHKQYRRSTAVTELVEFADRGHSLVCDSGSPELIAAALDWLKHKNVGPSVG